MATSIEENLKACRTLHIGLLGTSAAFFLLLVSPDDSSRLESALRTLRNLPPYAVQPKTWTTMNADVHKLQELRIREGATFDRVMVKYETRLSDAERKLNLWFVYQNQIRPPQRNTVLELSRLVDDAHYSIMPCPQGEAVANALSRFLSSEAGRWQVLSASVQYDNDRPERSTVLISLARNNLSRSLRVEKVLDSGTEAIALSIVKTIYYGDSDPIELDFPALRRYRSAAVDMSPSTSLAPYWDDVRSLSAEDAAKLIAARLDQSRQTVELAGFKVQSSIAVIFGPVLVICLFAAACLHVRQLNSGGISKLDNIRAYPLVFLIDGHLGIIATWSALIIVPGLVPALALAKLASAGTVVATGAPAWLVVMIYALAAIGFGYWLNVEIRRLRNSLQASSSSPPSQD
jgi:hypothetical protein